MSIRALPQSLVDQIAAGEVIERPASVVKELVENSLDAGAKEVEVQVEAGGRKRLSILDDGCGIPADELSLAVTSHATSKLRDLDDLLEVATFGFRGEALASVGSVSHLRLASRPADVKEGAEITVDGGRVGPVTPVGRRPGTRIDVRDLFFNTPARRKFLRTDATELSHILEAVLRLGLAKLDTAITVSTDARRSLRLEANTSLRDRIGAGYGRELAASLLEVKGGFPGLELTGFLAPPGQAKARTTLQHLFINDRWVRDRTVQGAVRRAFSDFLAESLRPIYFLFLRLDPREVDCNVHPTKSEVRLRNSSEVFRTVVGAVERTLRTADLTPRMRTSGRPSPLEETPLARPLAAAAAPSIVREPTLFPPRTDSGPGVLGAPPTAPAGPLDSAEVGAGGPPASPAHPLAPAASAAPVRLKPGRFVQVARTYLVTECEEGLLVLDQHALHERILYRQLRAQWNDRRVARQELLTPVRLELSAHEVVALTESEDLLERVGVRVAPFGPTELAVSAVPTTIGMRDIPGLVRRLAGLVVGDRPEGRADDFADRMLFTMACHRAIRAGDPLSDDLIASMLEEAERAEHTHTCPHGRPTRVIVPIAELEQLFKRRGF